MSFHGMAEFLPDSPFDHHHRRHHGVLLPPMPPPFEDPLFPSFVDFFHPKTSSSFSFHLDSDLFDSSLDLVQLHSTPYSSSFTRYRKEFHHPWSSSYHSFRSTVSPSAAALKCPVLRSPYLESLSACPFLKSPAASKCPVLQSSSSACPFLKTHSSSKCPIPHPSASECPILKSRAASKCPYLQSPSSQLALPKSPAASKCPYLYPQASKCPVLSSPESKCPFLPHPEAEKDAIFKCLSDRVSALELGFDEIFSAHHQPKTCKWEKVGKKGGRDASYSYEFESEGKKWGRDVSYSYKVVSDADHKEKWTAEIKGVHGEGSQVTATYKLEKGKPKKEKTPTVRVVEIEDGDFHKQELVAKRRAAAVAAIKHNRGGKGKKKELSPQDAAIAIQVTYRAHLAHRSQTLRGLRDLAVAKAKLAELRSFFHNFSYHHRVTVDAEERQRFSEKIIVLLLTVEAIEGTDMLIRDARRSMIRELEAMLNAVDPQPVSKLASFKRRKFDLPVHCSNSELTDMAKGVSDVVEMLNHEVHHSVSLE